MATAVKPRAAGSAAGGQHPADVLVVFGITGDLCFDRAEPEEISYDTNFGTEGRELAAPYEVLLHAPMNGDSARFTRQDSVEETWRILQPLLDDPPPVHEYANGSWGPAAADRLVAGYGGWKGPWT
ncbi:MAG TPA: hypothetical protein VFB51_16415 [Solirubrobacterales bacterium]|nr:hypothetical protein [Solirubrobacterales bacterium]